MRSPADMKVIQIDITNACTKRCANCTRFCGHHVKPFFMDFETFEKALDSLRGFKGIAGIMGGEPTIHPQFIKFVEHMRDNFGFDAPDLASYAPTPAFIDHISQHVTNYTRGQNNQRGLWTSISSKYADHFELIQDVFGVQCVNDHSNPSTHTTLMVTRKELGIPDDEWVTMRDNCWVQNNWSAAITHKGAFFCEVAAAMDATLDGPGGWPVEPGWWKRTPDQFGDQLNWCEMCSACLPVPKRNANDETDDVSPIWAEKLRQINSPKARKGLIAEFDPLAYDPNDHTITQGYQPYLDSNDKRMGVGQQILAPKNVIAVLDVTDGLPVEGLRRLIVENRKALGAHVLLSKNPDHHALAKELAVTVIDCSRDSGSQLYARLKETVGPEAWVLMLHEHMASVDLAEMIRRYVFNPGCFHTLYSAPNRPPFVVDFFNVRASALAEGGDLFNLKVTYSDRKRQLAEAPSVEAMIAAAQRRTRLTAAPTAAPTAASAAAE